MKTILTVVLFVSLLLGPSLRAETLPSVSAPAGFDEGTETRLTPAQVQEILPWATNSKQTLEDLLELIKTLSDRQAKAKLIAGFQSIVVASAPRRTETLLRVVLDRGLKIVGEIDQAADLGIPGTLAQEVRLLKLTAKLAISYFQNEGDLVSLPYARFGADYARFLMNLDDALFAARAQYRVAVTALGLLQWDLFRDQNKLTFAPEINKIYQFLQNMPNEEARISDQDAVMQLRQVRKIFQLVNASLDHEAGTAPVMKQCQNMDLRKAPENTICRTYKTGAQWQLVTRTEKGHEVWKDINTGLLWSDTLDSHSNFDTAQDRCHAHDSFDARGQLADVNFVVPSADDFITAEQDGIREVVPNMKYQFFWSSSVNPNYAGTAFGFDGDYGNVVGFDRSSLDGSVRCVSGR